ncbi:hypothetical protein IH979_02935 [Patescibacteria group bacterium]|nr:hypothetical protein [Patescibacteria group bacterium]
MKELLPIYRNTKMIPGAGPLKIPGTMFLIKAGEEVILIDPFALPQSEIEQLEALGVPTLILITGENHARDAEAYRKRYGAKILAHRQAAPELGIAVDDVFGDGETLPGGLRTLGMPGCTAGETIFRQDQRGGVLIVGDALYNLQLEECGLILGSIMLFASITGLADPPGRLNIMPKFFMVLWSMVKMLLSCWRKMVNVCFACIR